MKKIRIGLIGSGNMAFCLGKELLLAGYPITEIYSRNKTEGKKLSGLLKSEFHSEINKLQGNADVYFFCLQDDVINIVAEQFPFTDKIIVHTSGSVSIDVLKNNSKQFGVFYPVQSINKNVNVDWKNIPICIEASSASTLKTISEIAKSVSNSVQKINSEQRKRLHLAAVFANNFSNACFSMAKEILDESKLSFELIRPLILNTAMKVQSANPDSVQTGPAKRNDVKVLKEHQKLLNKHPELKKIYKLMTGYIANNK